jgi:hypothetical protein
MIRKAAPIPSRDKAAIFVILAVLLGGIAYGTNGRVEHIDASRGAADAAMIYSGLPADAAQANATFRARMLSNFPLLTSEDNLIQALSRQGFKSDGWVSKRMTFRRQNGSLRGCDFTASVVWQSDDHARISAIDPRFLRTPGCVDSF